MAIKSKAKVKDVVVKDQAVVEPTGKVKALGLALDSIEKQFGKGSIMKLGESTHSIVETVPTGCLSLDIALGGGFPKGTSCRNIWS